MEGEGRGRETARKPSKRRRPGCTRPPGVSFDDAGREAQAVVNRWHSVVDSASGRGGSADGVPAAPCRLQGDPPSGVGGTVIQTGERGGRHLLGAARADRIKNECAARFVESSAARAAHQQATVASPDGSIWTTALIFGQVATGNATFSTPLGVFSDSATSQPGVALVIFPGDEVATLSFASSYHLVRETGLDTESGEEFTFSARVQHSFNSLPLEYVPEPSTALLLAAGLAGLAAAGRRRSRH